MNKFKGLGVALVTPFLQSGEIDFESLDSLIENTIASGVDYLVAIGTTSESPTLKTNEKTQLVRAIVKKTAGRVPIMMGIGGPSTQQVVEDIKTLDLSGIEAILSVTPFYNRPSQEGLFAHYKEIAYYSPLPIVLYNVRSRAACNIDADTTLSLANECPNIIGIKEASGNLNQIMKLIKHKPEHFLVISGDDAITLPLLAAGADGLISVVANAFPKQIAEMVHLAQDNNFDKARHIHLSMLDITQACFKEGNPSGIKAFLALQGKINYYLRLPLTRVSSEHQSYMKDLLYTFNQNEN